MNNYFKYFIFNSLFLIGACVMLAKYFPTYFYSPEELSINHNKLTCEACHTPFSGVKSMNCVSIGCHTLEKINKSDPLLVGLHAKYQEKNCMYCHTDHVKPEGKVSLMLNHEYLEGWPKDQCMPCHEGADSKETHFNKYYSKNCSSCHSLYTWKVKDFDHGKLANRDQCGVCHFTPKDIMHDAEKNCVSCHVKTIEWIVGYGEILGSEPESRPQEGIEGFFSWGEMIVDGADFGRTAKAIEKWKKKLSALEKIKDINTEGLWTSVLEEGDAIFIMRKDRSDPIYKAVVKIFGDNPRRLLFSIDDDYGKIMEKPIPETDLENPILKEIFEAGYLEKGGAKTSLGYAEYLIESVSESLAHPGKIIRKIIIDPKAKDFMYSGDAASGIDSDF